MTPPVYITYGDNEGITFEVPSKSIPGEAYTVSWDFDNGWLCTCPGCLKGGHLCTHILAAEEYMKKMDMALLDDPTVFKSAGGLIGSD